MTYEERKQALKATGYRYHHTALARGYVSRVGDAYREEPYNGRFGAGKKIYRANMGSTSYCWVEYWVVGK